MCAGDVFYVIEEGTFTIFDNTGRELARVTKGSCFGELALMHQAGTLLPSNVPPVIQQRDQMFVAAVHSLRYLGWMPPAK